MYQVAYVQNNELLARVFIAADIDVSPCNWLAGLLAKGSISAQLHKSLLVDRDNSNYSDSGEMVSSCFAVGEHTVRQSIKAKNLTTPKEVGACLKAGTSCGLCI